MIKLLGKLPRKITVACSGGVDSMVALDFLRRNHTVEVLHFNHGTAHGEQAEEFVLRYCRKNSIPFLVDRVRSTIPPGRSREDWWRNQRYEFFDKYTDRPVVTCHHLDDCVETWIFSSLNGTGKSIPYRRNHVVRPFLLNRKRDLALWANLKNVPHIEDDSNAETCYNRNYIRHNMMPHVLEVNPGIHKVISRKVREEYERA
jgi:tRNA(Ile)-lysidine synthase|tara:strand:+ start:2844 stop:3449 length:606 start_codon:yes stop_codon:yes gene_type:complete